jgi:hypothetical protein
MAAVNALPQSLAPATAAPSRELIDGEQRGHRQCEGAKNGDCHGEAEHVYVAIGHALRRRWGGRDQAASDHLLAQVSK